MPNGSYVLCPYYTASKKTAITCEDCVREFFTTDSKSKHERRFCAGNWKQCSYARELDRLYDELAKPADEKDREIRKLEFENNAKATEITRIKRRMSKDRSKSEQDKRDVYALKHQLQVAKKENELIRKRAVEAEMISREKIKGLEAFMGMLCYEFGIDEFTLKSVQDYGRSYKTFYTISKDGNTVRIHRKKKNKEERRRYDRDKGSSTEIPGAGGEEAETAEQRQGEEAAAGDSGKEEQVSQPED